MVSQVCWTKSTISLKSVRHLSEVGLFWDCESLHFLLLLCLTAREIFFKPFFFSSSEAHFRRSPVIDRLQFQRTYCSNSPQDLGPIKRQLWRSRVPLFSWDHGQARYYFPTKLKPRLSARDRRVDQCIQTWEAPRFGWSKWPCIVQCQRALCFFFVGCVAEPKVNSWSEATLRQLFQDWLSVMWT